MLEDVNRAELLVGAVTELEAQEVTRVRRGRAAQLDRDGRAEVSCVSEVSVCTGDVERKSVRV